MLSYFGLNSARRKQVRSQNAVRKACGRISTLEHLESRQMMACNLDFNPDLDVDDNGYIVPLDALRIINDLNASGSREVGPGHPLDTSNDEFISPIDALLVINYLNAGHAGTSCLPSIRAVEEAFATDPLAEVANSQFLRLGQVTLTAQDGDMHVGGLTWNVHTGDGNNARDYILAGDTDNDGLMEILAHDVAAQNGIIPFDIDVLIPDGVSVTFQLRHDVASSLSADPRLRVALSDIEADLADTGESLAEQQVIIIDAPQPLYHYVASGHLFVTQDGALPLYQQMLAGTVGESMISMNLLAKNEYQEVTGFNILVEGNPQSLERFEFYVDGSVTPIATAIKTQVDYPVPAGYTAYRASAVARQFLLARDHMLDLDIRPRLRTDENGAVSGERIALKLPDNFVEVRGVTSHSELSGNDGDAIAEPGEIFVGISAPGPNANLVTNTSLVVLSNVDAVQNANPDANYSNVPTGVYPVGQFRFDADMNANTRNGLNRVAFESMTFFVSANNVQVDASAFRLYNKADSSVKMSCSVYDTAGNPLTGPVTGTLVVVCSGITASAVNLEVASGGSLVAVLEMDITNPKISASDDSILDVTLVTRDDMLVWKDRDASSDMTHYGFRLPYATVNSTIYNG